MNLRYRMFALAVPLSLAAMPAAAQTTFSVGGSLGLETVPSVLLIETPCSQLGNAEPIPFAEGRIGLSLASGLGVEVRGGSGPGWGGLGCGIPNSPTTAQPLFGRYTIYDHRGDQLARIDHLDLRLRQTLHGDRTVLTLGPGIIRDGPLYLAGSLGRRWDVPFAAGLHRWGFEAQLTAYRTAWQKTEIDIWDDPEDPAGVLVEERSSERIHLWELGVGIRGVVEFGFR